MVPDGLCSSNHGGHLSPRCADGLGAPLEELRFALELLYIAVLLPSDSSPSVVLRCGWSRHDFREQRGDGWSFSEWSPRARPGFAKFRGIRKCRWKWRVFCSPAIPNLPTECRRCRREQSRYGTFGILGLMQKKKVQELIVVEPLPPGLESEKLISNLPTGRNESASCASALMNFISRKPN